MKLGRVRVELVLVSLEHDRPSHEDTKHDSPTGKVGTDTASRGLVSVLSSVGSETGSSGHHFEGLFVWWLLS